MKTLLDGNGFMTIDHPNALLGMKKKAQPTEYHMDWTHECPACRGYGGHHLTVDAYGPGNHFDCSCFQCRGWGWVPKEDAECVHEFREISFYECRERDIHHYGSCWHVYECTKCGKTSAADSSG